MARVGRFRVSSLLIEDGFGPLIYEGMVPLRVEMLFFENLLDVTAISDAFEDVVRSAEPPLYRMEIKGDLTAGRLGNWHRELTRCAAPAGSELVQEMLGNPDGPLDFRLKVYPNPMRDDGVFVAEDREIAPYPGISNVDGTLCYPSTPNTQYRMGRQLPRDFAEELVRRWNAFCEQRGFGT